MKQGTRVEVNTFVKGLVTEASPLNFPANASFDEVNFELLRDGTRKRRLGMDFEYAYNLHDAAPLDGDGYKTTVTNKYIWEGAGSSSETTLMVVQMGNNVAIHKVELEGPLSYFENMVGSFLLEYDANVLYSFTTANGKLIVAGGGTHITVISYNDAEGVPNYARLKKISLPLKVRDLWGIEAEAEVEADVEYRPTTLSKEHEYNLCNQSWGMPRTFKAIVETNPRVVNPVQIYHGWSEKYPSNSEMVWTGLQYQAVSEGSNPYERIYPSLYEDRFGFDMNVARGRFILDLHERGNSRKAEMDKNAAKYPVMPPGQAYRRDYMTSGATVVGSYAGRVFYAGFSGEVLDGDKRSPALADHIFFTKLIKGDSDINACYQSGDPTSRDNSDVLETDGGFLRIADAHKIVALKEVGKNLAVLATNGVWIVTGGSDYGFSATNFRVEKVTNFGCVGPASIVEVNSDLLYWGAESIYRIGADNMGSLVANDFTAAVINSYYDKIHPISKALSRGIYDPVNKNIRWLYHVNEPFTDISYSIELVYDGLLNSFYQHKIVNFQNTELVDLLYTAERGINYLCIHRPPGTNAVKYSFCYYKEGSFADWRSIDGVGVDAKAYMLTGALTADDSGIAKQSPYLTAHFRRTETSTNDAGIPQNQSSCLMRCQWEWANDPKSKKFTSMTEIYRYRLPLFALPNDKYDNGFDTVITKSKLRGRGKAITLYFETSPLKDCQLLGWNLTINGNAVT